MKNEITYDFLTAIKCAEAVKEYLRPVSWRGSSQALFPHSGYLHRYGTSCIACIPSNEELLGQWEVIDLSVIKREER